MLAGSDTRKADRLIDMLKKDFGAREIGPLEAVPEIRKVVAALHEASQNPFGPSSHSSTARQS
jgi:hypothetical protein